MNKKEALEREDSPSPGVPPPPVAVAAGGGASVWMPSEGYFVPYFEHLSH